MPRRATNLQTTEKGGLDSRAEVLLAALIKEHLVTGEAVGSRVLSDRFSHGYGWSPATIRNVMADLEEAGLVEQPHTSAGRDTHRQGLPLLRRLHARRSASLAHRSESHRPHFLHQRYRRGCVAGSSDGDRVARALSAFAERRHRDFAFTGRQPAQSHRVCSPAGQANPGGIGVNGKHHPQQSDQSMPTI